MDLRRAGLSDHRAADLGDRGDRNFRAPDRAVRRPGAGELVAVDQGTLHRLGLSRRKAATVLDLAQRFSDGRLSETELRELTDQEVVRQLTGIKGIGAWTVQGALLIALQRPDVVRTDCRTRGPARGQHLHRLVGGRWVKAWLARRIRQRLHRPAESGLVYLRPASRAMITISMGPPITRATSPLAS
jgi:hypothetical protein